MSQKGKLIVVEGNDGSGKTTQFRLLCDQLNKAGYCVKTIKFPQHGKTFFGCLVDDYLNGKFGDAASIHPYLASVLYAADRWQAKDQMNEWLHKGEILVLDRYMTANKGHQVGKLATDKEKIDCLKWLDTMEYEVFGIPRPDLVFYLDMPVEFNIRLMSKRDSYGKEYIDGDHDQHESNVDYLLSVRLAYQFTAQQYAYWHQVECVKDGKLLSPEKIHEKVWEIVRNNI